MLKLRGLLLVFVFVLPMIMAKPKPQGKKTAAAIVAASALGIGLATSGQDCEDVGIDKNACAALYDEENCKRSSKFLVLQPGDQGVLPLATFTKLRRNDVESLIVRRRCKLELWDDDEGLAKKPNNPDLVIDKTSRLTRGDEYIDDLSDDYENLDEKISAYKCTCRNSTLSTLFG